LSAPGLVPAGRHLRAGLELAVEDVSEAGGIRSRPIDLVVADSAGDPARAVEAFEAFCADGVVGVVGEYHSMVATRLAERADALQLPFICSSATLADLCSRPTDLVARLAAPQSLGWRIYAEQLLAAGHRHVALALHPDRYWSSGANVLETRLRAGGARCTAVETSGLTVEQVVERVAALDVDMLLLLVGFPEPLASIVRTVRSHDHLAGLALGDPAGRAEFTEWSSVVGDAAGPVPYLRYRPTRLTDLGARAWDRLTRRLGEAPSFVALEGYDTVQLLTAGLHQRADRTGLRDALPRVHAQGTRGPLSLVRPPGSHILELLSPPVQVVAGAANSQVTVLHEGSSPSSPR
jgi:ABC-type branched-subunit amino acid transport system substrate-binding protein